MRKVLLALLLLLPALSYAQKLEVSLKGGVAPNTLPQKSANDETIEKPVTLYGSLSATIGLLGKIRAGVSVSAYNLEYNTTKIVPYPGDVTYGNVYEYGNPVVPVEVIVLKRFNVSKLSFDAGLVGGVSVTKKMYWFDYLTNQTFEKRDSATGTWYTYGLLLAGQVNLSKHLAIGVEGQAKRQHIGLKGREQIFIFPAMVKLCVRI